MIEIVIIVIDMTNFVINVIKLVIFVINFVIYLWSILWSVLWPNNVIKKCDQICNESRVINF